MVAFTIRIPTDIASMSAILCTQFLLIGFFIDQVPFYNYIHTISLFAYIFLTICNTIKVSTDLKTSENLLEFDVVDIYKQWIITFNSLECQIS